MNMTETRITLNKGQAQNKGFGRKSIPSSY